MDLHKCSACRKPYSTWRHAKHLPCGHDICEPCAVACWEEQGQLNCPECSTTTHQVDNMIQCFGMQNESWPSCLSHQARQEWICCSHLVLLCENCKHKGPDCVVKDMFGDSYEIRRKLLRKAEKLKSSLAYIPQSLRSYYDVREKCGFDQLLSLVVELRRAAAVLRCACREAATGVNLQALAPYCARCKRGGTQEEVDLVGDGDVEVVARLCELGRVHLQHCSYDHVSRNMMKVRDSRPRLSVAQALAVVRRLTTTAHSREASKATKVLCPTCCRAYDTSFEFTFYQLPCKGEAIHAICRRCYNRQQDYITCPLDGERFACAEVQVVKLEHAGIAEIRPSLRVDLVNGGIIENAANAWAVLLGQSTAVLTFESLVGVNLHGLVLGCPTLLDQQVELTEILLSKTIAQCTDAAVGCRPLDLHQNESKTCVVHLRKSLRISAEVCYTLWLTFNSVLPMALYQSARELTGQVMGEDFVMWKIHQVPRRESPGPVLSLLYHD